VGGGGDVEAFDPDTTAPLEQRIRDIEKALPTSGLAGLAGLFSSTAFGSKNTWAGSVGVTQRLFQGGSIWGSIAAARHAMAAADLNKVDRSEDVILGVRQAYLVALLADRQVRIAELALEQAETQLERVRLRQEAGQTSEFELLQAEVERDNQVPAVKAASAGRTVAFLELTRLSNVPPTRPLLLSTQLLDASLFSTEPMLPDTSGLVDAALDNAGIRAMEAVLAARSHAVAVAKADNWPDLSLFLNYSRQAYPSESFPESGDWRKDINAGARFNWNIFDGFRTKGAIQQAKANESVARQTVRQARESVQEAMIQNRWELERSALEVQARSRTVEFARRAYELAALRQEEGASSVLEVNDARIAYQLARLYEAQARFDYLLALARLERLSGRPLFTTAAEAGGVSRTDQR
jgi:outer membrane protein TolC